jgi:hypothetical protein
VTILRKKFSPPMEVAARRERGIEVYDIGNNATLAGNANATEIPVRRYQQGGTMLNHWLIDLIGHLSGLSDAQLKEIEKSLPATKALIDLFNRAQPIIEQAQSLYAEAEPSSFPSPFLRSSRRAARGWSSPAPYRVSVWPDRAYLGFFRLRGRPVRRCLPRRLECGNPPKPAIACTN